MMQGPIGIFDSGYGGLTILEEIQKRLSDHDFVYLGDNARSPYGTRSFEIVYRFTWQAVEKLFQMGCPLVILACNTASAKALRSIQQINLSSFYPDRRVLGIIRPTAEIVGSITQNNHIGLVATPGTIQSDSYTIEIQKLYPNVSLVSHACKMWVPLIENGEKETPGADYFVRQDLDTLFAMDSEIDTLLLGCTHYPLLKDKIAAAIPAHVRIVCQGEYVAQSLENYLERHPEMSQRLSKSGNTDYYTTESVEKFSQNASIFLQKIIQAEPIIIDD